MDSETRGSSIKEDVQSIQEQLDDHLTAINENSNEIEGNYEFLCELEEKIEKLNSRIDELFCLVQNRQADRKLDTFAPQYDPKPLNRAEKEVFAAIYWLNETKEEFNYPQIAEKAKISEELARFYVTALITKGIPLKKHYVNGTVMIHIESSFRDVQRQKNVIKLNPALFNSLNHQ